MAPPFNPLITTSLELQSHLKSGSLTSVQILETYLAQMERHNHAGQKLNAIISISPRDSLLAQAKALDEERKDGRLRGPLHGLPTIVKDCFTFAPEAGLKTTVGSHVFAREKAKGNAVVIQQLIDQGVIILGTANLTVTLDVHSLCRKLLTREQEFCGYRCVSLD
jgi:amidase